METPLQWLPRVPDQVEFDHLRRSWWTDPEAGGAQQDSEIARSRKKITSLKTRLKDVEWKLRIVATLGVVGVTVNVTMIFCAVSFVNMFECMNESVVLISKHKAEDMCYNTLK
ncbi:hypothetical protein AHAS_Ahas18G0247500 [Arachis hypogaea]